jgi:hypothetical protein
MLRSVVNYCEAQPWYQVTMTIFVGLGCWKLIEICQAVSDFVRSFAP